MSYLGARLDSWLRFPRGRFVVEEAQGIFTEVLGAKSRDELVIRRVPVNEALALFSLRRYLKGDIRGDGT